jgi:hypothetical protein
MVQLRQGTAVVQETVRAGHRDYCVEGSHSFLLGKEHRRDSLDEEERKISAFAVTNTIGAATIKFM